MSQERDRKSLIESSRHLLERCRDPMDLVKENLNLEDFPFNGVSSNLNDFETPKL